MFSRRATAALCRSMGASAVRTGGAARRLSMQAGMAGMARVAMPAVKSSMMRWQDRRWASEASEASLLDGLIKRMEEALDCINKQDYKGAVEKYASILADSPNIEAYYNKGVAHWLLNEKEGAQEAWLSAVQLAEEIGQVKLAVDNEQLARYKAIQDQLVSSAHTNLANILTLDGDLETALQHIEKAADLQPEDPELVFNWGIALDMKGDPHGALAKYTKAKEMGLSKEHVEPYIRNAGAKAAGKESKD